MPRVGTTCNVTDEELGKVAVETLLGEGELMCVPLVRGVCAREVTVKVGETVYIKNPMWGYWLAPNAYEQVGAAIKERLRG